MSIKLLPILLIFVSVVILCGLGTWQIQRLNWKNDIIEQLEVEYAKDPLAHNFTLYDLTKNTQLQYGSATGRFDYKKEILVGPTPAHDGVGYRVITPLQLQTGGYLLVNRGWVETDKIDNLKNSHIRNDVTIIGVFRKPDWNKFTPENSPKNNIWTKLDIDQIADFQNITPVAPVLLYAESASEKMPPLMMQTERWFPRNKHKQYAIFWFTMALALLGVCGFYRRQNYPNH